LVVEDQLVAALSLRAILVTDSHVVEIAENAETALAMFRASQYDLVVTDFKLATMDGLQLAAAIKHLSPPTPVFLVTAYVEQFPGKVPNVDLVLGKPFSVAQFQRAVRNALSTP
jgi:CheY-like chemotaxis protein